MSFSWQVHTAIAQLDRAQFESLMTADPTQKTPFLSYHFLHALEHSDSVGTQESGWLPHHLGIYQHQRLVGFMPCYLKSHSYGEYIFDHSWANAYHHHGHEYFPKLVACIPFTPVTGSRLLVQKDVDEAAIYDFVAKNAKQICEQHDCSSFHYLFLPQQASDKISQHECMQRLSVQFVWTNQDYSDFQSFLDTMTSRRRRSIRKERQAIAKQNVQINTLTNEALSPDALSAFYLCYQQTYLKRSGHSGYLNKAFFDYIFEHMRDKIMIVSAQQDQEIIASALFFYNEHQLFGRYWGALKDVSGLHFECCYYQGIDFAIENKVEIFNPGTQGEHKILRGFSPTLCYSNHYIEHEEFRGAIKDFLEHEARGIKEYKDKASTVLPYKHDDALSLSSGGTSKHKEAPKRVAVKVINNLE